MKILTKAFVDEGKGVSMKKMWAAFFHPLILFLAALFLLLPAALLSGCGDGGGTAPGTTDAAVPVMVTAATRGDVEAAISFTGVLEPETVVNVVHKTGGKAAEVKVKDGDRVQAGDLLIRLDAAELSAQAAQAEAACEMALIQFETATKILADTEALYREEIISRQQFEQVETEHKVAEVQVAQAEAALQLIHTHLDDTFITAPIGGTISGMVINPGEIVAPGNPVATINKLDSMEVQVSLTEKDVNRVAAGQEIDVLVPAVSPEPLLGTIQSISPVAEPRTKTYQLKATLPNADGRLKAGMTATIQAVVEAERDTVIIPVEALLLQEDRQIVYVIGDGLARRRTVTVGLENGTAVSVLEGIEPGEQVVVRGQHYLRENSKVTIVEGGGAEQ